MTLKDEIDRARADWEVAADAQDTGTSLIPALRLYELQLRQGVEERQGRKNPKSSAFELSEWRFALSLHKSIAALLQRSFDSHAATGLPFGEVEVRELVFQGLRLGQLLGSLEQLEKELARRYGNVGGRALKPKQKAKTAAWQGAARPLILQSGSRTIEAVAIDVQTAWKETRIPAPGLTSLRNLIKTMIAAGEFKIGNEVGSLPH